MAQGSNRTIPVKWFTRIQEEKAAKSAILPGMLLDIGAAGTLFPHDVASGFAQRIFALEDDLQGKGIDDSYAAGDLVQFGYFRNGDVVLAVLADGQNIAIGDALESAGGGLLQKSSAQQSTATGEETQSIVAIAEEALDMSGSSGVESSSLAAHARIKVRIV